MYTFDKYPFFEKKSLKSFIFLFFVSLKDMFLQLLALHVRKVIPVRFMSSFTHHDFVSCEAFF